MNRATIGTRIDLNMARFQEMPLIPKNGYSPKKDVSVRAYTKPYAPPSTGQQIKEQRRRDQMAANNRRTALNRMDRVKKLFKDKELVSAQDAMTILDYSCIRRANDALARMKEAGLIEKAVVERKGKTLWRKAK